MKYLKSAIYALGACILITCNLQCSTSKYKLEEQSQLNPKGVYFQEWYAGIKVGGTGFNIFFPNLNSEEKVVIDSVYFRRMKAKLVKGRANYSAILKRSNKYYKDVNVYYNDNKKLDKKANFPFTLKENECVISYIQNGETKYLKIRNVLEREGIYYEQGPPVTLNDNDF